VANPYSPMVQERLLEEEAGDIRPVIGKEGIIKFIQTTLDQQCNVGNDCNFTFKLFSFYPTFALFIVDDEYMVYPYSYRQVGNFSPVSSFSKKAKELDIMIKFLDDHYQRVKAASVDAKLIYDLEYGRSVDMNQLFPFAFYLVPPQNSPLYQFGSEVLGYDIRERHYYTSKWADYVGNAHNFGFHLTVADALYAANVQEIIHLEKTFEKISEEYFPFNLTNIRIQPGFPNAHSISLLCDEESGNLESLHFELVFRGYRRAIASNYNIGSAKKDCDPNLKRADLMIKRYHAPYILKKFKPHFTLLTQVPPEKMKQVTNEITKFFNEKVTESYIEVRGISLMRRHQTDKPWDIEKELNFKNR